MAKVTKVRSEKNFVVVVFFFLTCHFSYVLFCDPEKVEGSLAVRLSADCLFSVLSFGAPLEVWSHRLTSIDWKHAAFVTLSRVRTYDFGEEEEPTSRHVVRQVVGICRNLVEVHGTVVTKILECHFWVLSIIFFCF